MTLDWTILAGNAGALIAQGLVVTLKLSAFSLVGAFAIGLVFGVTYWLRLPVATPVLRLYVDFSRNTPAVVQLLFWYFSASFILPEWLFVSLRDIGYEFGAAVVALSIYHGGFLTEIIRAGLNAIPKGQFEGSRALGNSLWHALTRVMMPQALRILAPTLVNEVSALVKNTSIAVAVGVTELTYQYKYIDNFQFRGIEALTAITAIYFVICLVIAGVGTLVSKRLSRHVAGSLPIRAELTSD